MTVKKLKQGQYYLVLNDEAFFTAQYAAEWRGTHRSKVGQVYQLRGSLMIGLDGREFIVNHDSRKHVKPAPKKKVAQYRRLSKGWPDGWTYSISER